MIIKQEVLQTLKENVTLKARLCAVFNKHFGTIERWINQNSDNGPLTTITALDAIKEVTGLTREQIFETESAASAIQ